MPDYKIFIEDEHVVICKIAQDSVMGFFLHKGLSLEDIAREMLETLHSAGVNATFTGNEPNQETFDAIRESD